MWQRRARFELRLWLPSGCAPHFRRLSLNVIKQINLSEGFGVSRPQLPFRSAPWYGNLALAKNTDTAVRWCANRPALSPPAHPHYHDWWHTVNCRLALVEDGQVPK